MDDAERLAWLGLCWGAEIGPAGFARLLAAHGSAVAALEASEDELVYGEARLKQPQAAAVQRVRHTLDGYGRLADQVRANGVHVHFSPDEDYPAILRELPHPPPIVCIKGRLLPADAMAVGIVGTRSPSHEGADMATKLAMAAAADEFTVVSGLARGIDTAAHLGALNREGRTIAIIGSGIANITPAENVELAERIAGASEEPRGAGHPGPAARGAGHPGPPNGPTNEPTDGRSRMSRPTRACCGAILSELSPVAQPTIPNLMARNRLIALFSRGVIVVECRATGGSLATAQAALQQGRRLYVVRWPEPDELREGCAQLLAQGAEAISGPQDMRTVGLQLRTWEHHTEAPHAPEERPQLSLF